MDNREIAKELAVACLGHDVVAGMFRPASADKANSAAAGERVGEFYNAIWKTLEQESLASAKGPTAHQF